MGEPVGDPLRSRDSRRRAGFIDTRVPLKAFIDYLIAGESLAEFLEDYPSVTREQAVAVLRLAAHALVADARPA